MSNFKAPICSIMGHVDAGKTSLIDYIKKSNKVKDEAGGITQTISSSYIDHAKSNEKKYKDPDSGQQRMNHQISLCLPLRFSSPRKDNIISWREHHGRQNSLFRSTLKRAQISAREFSGDSLYSTAIRMKYFISTTNQTNIGDI